MNLDETADEVSFRAEIRTWLSEHVAPMLGPNPSFVDRREVDRRLAAAGYLGCSWPVEFGGSGAGPVQAAILDEECARVGVPRAQSPSRFGVDLLSAALFTHATSDQQNEFLTPIRRAETIWCQGFSEPEAGSDLANVQSFATDVGDHLLLNGSKTWTTQAHEADWCFALVRSDPQAPRHRNLSFVLFPMDQSGITIRPIHQLTGDAEFNELYFDDVRVEHRHVIGGLGGGWRVAMTTVGAERSYGQLSRYHTYAAQLREITNMVHHCDPGRRRSWESQLGSLSADLTGIRNASYKIVSLAAAGAPLGSLPSVVKLWWSSTHQRLMDLGRDVAIDTNGDVDFWSTEWLRSRAESIYAGTSQVQRNIIAERMLGLPK